MAELGYISAAQAREAKPAASGSTPPLTTSTHREPYFFDYVEDG